MGTLAETNLALISNRIVCRAKAICVTVQKGLSPAEAKKTFEESGINLSLEEEDTVRGAVEAKLNA